MKMSRLNPRKSHHMYLGKNPDDNEERHFNSLTIRSTKR